VKAGWIGRCSHSNYGIYRRVGGAGIVLEITERYLNDILPEVLSINKNGTLWVPVKCYYPCFVGTSVKYSWQVFLAKSEATHQLTVMPMFVQW